MADETKSAIGIMAYIKAWIIGNRVFMTALRRGEDGRASVPADENFGDYFTWCFELGLSLKPLGDQLGPAARTMIVAWALAELKRFLEDLAKGGKLALVALAALLLLPASGLAAAGDTVSAVVTPALEATSSSGGLAGILSQATEVMNWAVVNQGLIIGFITALVAIYAALQKIHRGRNRAALDAFTGEIPAEQAEQILAGLTPAIRSKAAASLARSKTIK